LVSTEQEPALIPTRRDVDARARRRFLVALSFLTLFAWLLREYFVLATVVEAPIRGDVRDYVAYAWNLVHHGVFSRVWPSQAIPMPDGFRGPGYPLVLAAAMALKADPEGWYRLMLHAQALIGAITVTGTVLLARHWLSTRWALFAGLLLALWPHHIAATGALLSEVVLGAALAWAMLCVACVHAASRPRAWAIAAGAAFGYAYLVNPLVLFLPFLIAALAWRGGKGKAAAWMLVIFLLPVAIWGVRGALLPDGGSGDRAKVNLVEGSWPLYHAAYVSRNASPIAHAIMIAIDREERLLKSDPHAGLVEMGTRMAREPFVYARWYVLDKPWLLWDWDIRLGAGSGGLYVEKVTHSPLATNPTLRVTTSMLHLLNPLVFFLAFVAALALVIGTWQRRSWAGPAATMVALLFLYVTAAHALLQAEPRYSTPYRPFELLLCVTALATATRRILGRRIHMTQNVTDGPNLSQAPLTSHFEP
jgi:hypothetical protein